MEDFGWTILYILKFYQVISSKGGKFYTFKNLTRSSAQGVENFIHSKILQGIQLKGWKILYFQKSYKVIIGLVGFQMSRLEFQDSDPGPLAIRPLA